MPAIIALKDRADMQGTVRYKYDGPSALFHPS